MIASPGIPALLVLVTGALLVAGCETTQEKSAKIAAALGPVKEEKGLEIDKESEDVEVLDTTLLTDANGSAVVVEVKSNSDDVLVDVPIAIDVLDAKGENVYTNTLPGLEETLTSIPVLQPGETLAWVNNQILATGEPDEVKVKVGADAGTLSGELPDIEVSDAELENDAVSGINAAGTAINNTDEQLERLTLYGVARDGDEIVAAGRAAIENLNPGRQKVYRVYFIGDPKGAELSVTSFPTLEPEQGETGDTDG